jgi:hypothetical protein
VKLASKLPGEEIRERARSGLNGVSAHEQCIDFQRAEVPVGQNANERSAFQLSPHTIEARGDDTQPSLRAGDRTFSDCHRQLTFRTDGRHARPCGRRTSARHGRADDDGVVWSSPE